MLSREKDRNSVSGRRWLKDLLLFISGYCQRCFCSWEAHIHITYEHISGRTYYQPPTQSTRMSFNFSATSTGNLTTNETSKVLPSHIDDRISALKQEAETIRHAFEQLTWFVQSNSMLPFNDVFTDYLDYMIKLEEGEQSASKGLDVVTNLQRIKREHREHVELLKKTISTRDSKDANRTVLSPNDMLDLVQTLYELPIHGKQIREQVEGIMVSEKKIEKRVDHPVSLPHHAWSTKIMIALKNLLES